jgi:hypothetical protein
LKKYEGSNAVDEAGRRLDSRGFDEVKDSTIVKAWRTTPPHRVGLVGSLGAAICHEKEDVTHADIHGRAHDGRWGIRC